MIVLIDYNAYVLCMFRHIRYLNFTHGWRESAKYNNLMYGVASLVLEELEGDKWEKLVQLNLLQPLEMHSTTFVHDLNDQQRDNVATSYVVDDSGKFVPLSIDIAK